MSKNQEYYTKKILESWSIKKHEGIDTLDEIMMWIDNIKKNTHVKITPSKISDSSFWFYDDYNGEILNVKRSFFSIKGIRYFRNSQLLYEQPIIDQPEIGYLGILCKELNGVLCFLMQAKIEPGNINCVQISPTIQATKSNFTRMHGGKLPHYFDLFENTSNNYVLFDQIQSEQGSRFYKKRNRNLMIITDENIELFPNFKWMTLGQIKELMRVDNLVNMDTRTVLSGIPLSTVRFDDDCLESIEHLFSDPSLFNSVFRGQNDLTTKLLSKINDFKMFNNCSSEFIPLNQLVDWTIKDDGVFCTHNYDFSVGYFDIEIAGREVKKWSQPLLMSSGMATFVLATKNVKNKKMFLVKINPEVGSFDYAEIGPSAHWESTHDIKQDTVVDTFIRQSLEKYPRIIDVVLSEEGGRFYQEQNRNVVVEFGENDLESIPDDYMWVDYSCINRLIQSNNYVNIQLRNLISMLKI